jgi:superfamily I DNA and/or RNA helicase
LENGNKKNYVNYHEVYIVKEYLKHFPYEELKNVGIITPYGQQLKIFQKEFAAEIKDFGLTVKTCDGFQGGEKDYIFISLVRSNLEGNIGFCGEENRINVSITRARRGMMIVGNSLTFLKNVNYWGMIINHVYSINRAYFNFEVDIPQAEIDKIIANYREKKEIGNEGDSLPQSNPNCLTYD